jgi:Flp pilus assembly protein TadB
MEELAGWLACFIVALVAIGLVIEGIIWVLINMWWLLLTVIVVLVIWWVYQHPGVRAKRELKSLVDRGNRVRAEIRQVTEHTKAEMDRVARDWKSRP